MYCPACGSEFPEGTAYCPGCGSAVQQPNAYYGQPQNEQYYPSNAVPSPQPGGAPYYQNVAEYNAPAAAPAQKSVNLFTVLIAVVVAVALIITGVIIVPKFTGRSGGFGGSANPFSAAAGSVKKKSPQYYTLDAIGSVFNTVFDSESLTVNCSVQEDIDEYENIMNAQVAFGKDLFDTAAYIVVEDEPFFVMQDGNLIASDGWDCYEFSVQDFVSYSQGGVSFPDIDDEFTGKEAELYNAFMSCFNELLDKYKGDLSKTNELVSGHKINLGLINSLSEFWAIFIENYLLLNIAMDDECQYVPVKEAAINLNEALGIIAGFFAQASSIDTTKSGDTYHMTFNIRTVAADFVNYLQMNAVLDKIIPDSEIAMDLMEEMRDELSYMDSMTMTVDVTTNGGKAEDIVLSFNDYDEKLLVNVRNINNTTVPAGVYNTVRGSGEIVRPSMDDLFGYFW